MARTAIPNSLARRHLLEKKISESHALSLAEAYLEADRPSDALAFLVRAGASEKLAEMRKRAIEAGDAFLLRAVCDALRVEASPSDWRRLGDVAESSGKMLYAEEARRYQARGES